MSSQPLLPPGANGRCNEEKPQSAGDSSSAADADGKQHPTDRENEKYSSARTRGGFNSDVAEAKGGQRTVSGDGGDGDEKGAGGELALLGDLPSLGRKMVSQRVGSIQASIFRSKKQNGHRVT